MGRQFCKNFLILVKCSRDLSKKPDLFRCKKIRSFMLVSPLCACPMRSKKCEWKPGFRIGLSVRKICTPCITGVQYLGGYDACGDILSTVVDVQYRGGCHEYRGGLS